MFRWTCISILSAIFGLFCLAPSQAAEWVTAKSDGSGWWVNGGVVHDRTYEKDRSEAAYCEDCFWWVHVICRSWEDENHGWCPSMRLRCPADMQLVEIFRANATVRPSVDSEKWKRTGYSCVGDRGPIAFGQIVERINEEKYFRPPELKVSASPPNSTVVNLEVKLQFSSSDKMPERQFILAGQTIKFSAFAERAIACSKCQKVSSTVLIWHSRGMDTLDIQSIWQPTIQAADLKLSLPINAIEQTQKMKFEIRALTRRLK